MRTLNVELAERRYPIHIGAGVLEQAELITAYKKQKRAAVVTNETVAPLYLERLSEALTARGVAIVPIVLPDGEAYKSWETLNTLFDTLLDQRC